VIEFLGRKRPVEGWGVFLLVATVVLCVPFTTMAADWVPGDGGLLPLAILALLVGRWLALRREWEWGIWVLVGSSLGLLAALCVAARTLPLLPASSAASSDFAMRWLAWLGAALGSGTNDDPDIFLFYAAILCWGAVLLMAWGFYRRRLPMMALVPPTALTAVTVFYSSQSIGWLALELGCGILLLALGNLSRARSVWETAGVDYASGLEQDISIAGGAIAAVVVLVSLLGPQFSVRRISDWFWRTVEEPSDQIEQTMDRLFGGVELSSSGSADGTGLQSGATSHLPQSHLLGGRPDLLEEVMMKVWTDEPPPLPEDLPHDVPSRIPPHYWRGVTLDRYSGRGWEMTVDYSEEVTGTLPLPTPPAYREVTQRFEFTAPHGDTLYAMNAPVWIGELVEAAWRGSDDLARLASEVAGYTVVSQVPEPTASELQAASRDYPEDVDERYLQVPDSVPQRVVDLALEVVAEGETVYERARLLERYLRTYPYSLDVEQPPEDRDVVDYFLFGVREGYCDYYASAFVVMARSVGIPSRLASGYVGGQYDRSIDAYLVRQKSGHSWPEVYFPGWGWIGFEPTASRAVTELPEDVPVPGDKVPGPTGPPARLVRLGWRRVAYWLLALIGLAVVVRVLRLYMRRQDTQMVTVRSVWLRVGRGGARMGVSPDPALTPQEYAEALTAQLHDRAEQTRRWRNRWMESAGRCEATLNRLAAMYTLDVYGGDQALVPDQQTVREMWRWLGRALPWFVWLGWFQSRGRSRVASR
jgi:transglutaminase-like putative cysteine protease